MQSMEKVLSTQLSSVLRQKIDSKTKPLGSLGYLEDIAFQIGIIQQSLTPSLNNPHIIVFAGDHGITAEGVSAFPQEVTHQMVLNFLGGGAAINIFCRQNKIDITVVDAGVNFDFPKAVPLINAKVAKGTRNFLKEKAMSAPECWQALDRGAEIVEHICQSGCNVIGFGEMGIGNTASASALMSAASGIPIEDCVGRGTGLNDEQLRHKTKVLKEALLKWQGEVHSPLDILAAFGGFEIAMMCGAMLKAAQRKMIILVDGFISTAAFLIVYRIEHAVKGYAFFCHQSQEAGHKKILQYLEVKPILDLNLRLGEGTGAALAYPLLQSAVNFLNEMASFDSAGVSKKKD